MKPIIIDLEIKDLEKPELDIIKINEVEVNTVEVNKIELYEVKINGIRHIIPKSMVSKMYEKAKEIINRKRAK